MATIDVGGGGAGGMPRRTVNHELTLVPFIDFLLCIVAFLLVTAVWSQMARVDASAAAPGAPAVPDAPVTPELHVDMRHEERFLLEWRQHGVVLSQTTVPRSPSAAPDGVVRYPALATQVRSSWQKTGAHFAASDAARDRAVLHAGNTAPFEEVIAAMDAIHAARRATMAGETAAFDVVFAVD